MPVRPETLEDAAAARLAPPPQQSTHPHGHEQPGHDHDGDDEAEGHEHAETVEWIELARIGFVALAAAAVWFHVWEPLARVSVLGLVGVAVGGYPIFKEAWENIRERRMTMELSMTIALVAALLIGEFFTALVITGFVLVAEVLEGLTVGRGRRAIHDLLDYLPQTAVVRRTGGPREIPASELRVGDIVLVAPGARIAVDGHVLGGHSYVDEATITGESVPVEKTVGASVYAGTVNQSGTLDVAAERLGRDTSFGKIVEAVESAERSRAPVQKTADRYAGYLVYFALSCAVLTFAITRNITSTISVIIVAGACGIAAGTPLAILGAIGRSARAGAIVKGGRYLEALWDIDTVAFDKTGTVTIGAPEVGAIRPADGTERELLEVAAIAERRSEHPLARAIVARADAAGVSTVEPATFDYTPGRGVMATTDSGDRILAGTAAFLAERGVTAASPGHVGARRGRRALSPVFIARNGRYAGMIEVADAVRPGAVGAVRALRGMGLRTVLLTGDVQAVADAVAEELHVDQVGAELLPADKGAAVRDLLAKGRRVAMVGDGVNDAPALTEATVGIAMGSGTDVARESADIVLLGSHLGAFVETVRIARRCRAIIRFNFIGTVSVDMLGVALAALGYLNPLLAAFIHVASELTFILNSARLLPAVSRSASTPPKERTPVAATAAT
jgi:heavy metal translocating P-type ATPase